MKVGFKNKKRKHIPSPTLSRLCKIYNLLEEFENNGLSTISSKEIGKRLGVGSHNIRKDFSYLVESGTSGLGYDISKLKELIKNSLGFEREINVCIVGLGKLGTALMNYEMPMAQNFKIVAGFDSNINRIETIKTSVPVFPGYEIKNIISSKEIELAVLTVPGSQAHKASNQLIQGGIKGIVNFTPVLLDFSLEDVMISNIDLISEFRYLSAQFSMKYDEEK